MQVPKPSSQLCSGTHRPYRAASRGPGRNHSPCAATSPAHQGSLLGGHRHTRHPGNINISWAAPSWPPILFSIVMKQFRISNSGLIGCCQPVSQSRRGNYFKSLRRGCSLHWLPRLSVCGSGCASSGSEHPVSPHRKRTSGRLLRHPPRNLRGWEGHTRLTEG